MIVLNINWSECVEKANNKADVAHEILAMLIEELPTTLNTLQQQWQKQEFKYLEQTIHRLQGGCCYTGVPHLKTSLQFAMDQLRGDHQQLEFAINNVQQAIHELICEYQTSKGIL